MRRIREERARLGWTQSDLADRVGVTLRSVQRWESGERSPSLHQLARIASALGVSSGSLLGEAKETPVSGVA